MFDGISGDGDSLNGRSALFQPHCAAVAVESLNRAVLAILKVAYAAEDLQHLITDFSAMK